MISAAVCSVGAGTVSRNSWKAVSDAVCCGANEAMVEDAAGFSFSVPPILVFIHLLSRLSRRVSPVLVLYLYETRATHLRFRPNLQITAVRTGHRFAWRTVVMRTWKRLTLRLFKRSRPGLGEAKDRDVSPRFALCPTFVEPPGLVRSTPPFHTFQSNHGTCD